MKEIKKLLHDAWLNGFTHGLNPATIDDPFEIWFNSVDIKSFLIIGNASNEINKH